MNICELYVLICIQGRLQATVRNFRVNDLWKIGSKEYFHKIQKTQYFLRSTSSALCGFITAQDSGGMHSRRHQNGQPCLNTHVIPFHSYRM